MSKTFTVLSSVAYQSFLLNLNVIKFQFNIGYYNYLHICSNCFINLTTVIDHMFFSVRLYILMMMLCLNRKNC